jgi:hypothetical protein
VPASAGMKCLLDADRACKRTTSGGDPGTRVEIALVGDSGEEGLTAALASLQGRAGASCLPTMATIDEDQGPSFLPAHLAAAARPDRQHAARRRQRQVSEGPSPPGSPCSVWVRQRRASLDLTGKERISQLSTRETCLSADNLHHVAFLAL